MYKVIVVGDTGVGKTSLLHRVKTGEFPEEHNTTVGVEFINYDLLINETDSVKLQIWDTAG